MVKGGKIVTVREQQHDDAPGGVRCGAFTTVLREGNGGTKEFHTDRLCEELGLPESGVRSSVREGEAVQAEAFVTLATRKKNK